MIGIHDPFLAPQVDDVAVVQIHYPCGNHSWRRYRVVTVYERRVIIEQLGDHGHAQAMTSYDRITGELRNGTRVSHLERTCDDPGSPVRY